MYGMMTSSAAGTRHDAAATLPCAALSVGDLKLTPESPPLSFTVAEGECLALLDLSSSRDGLHRLVDALAGHQPPSAGRIATRGQDVTALPPGGRHIAVVGTRDPLFAHLTVRENVLFPLRARGLARGDAARQGAQQLALLGLDAVADQPPAALTDGLRVRAAIARALATDPAVIICDNILSGLDTETRRDLHQRLGRLRRARGLNLLLLTHDRMDALLAARRIGILADGALLQLGDAASLLERPSCARVAAAIGQANLMVGLVHDIEDDIARIRLASGGEMEAMADPDLSAGDLAELCVRPNQIATLFPRQGGGAEEEEGCLPATLVDSAHLGDVVELRFRLEDGAEMIVHRPPGTLPPRLSPGRPVLLAWQASGALAFPFDDKRG